jgi:GGDEF domain-containing protein
MERTRGMRFQDPRATRLVAIGRGIIMAEPNSPLGAVSKDASAEPDAAYVVIAERTRIVGWSSIAAVRAACSDGQGDVPVIALSRGIPNTLDGSATVIDALDVASSRPEPAIGDPIIITEGAMPIAAISARDLLRLAARVCEGVERRTAAITGLPGRVRCEQHLAARMLGCVDDSIDVAFIDLRNFATYNEDFGFELGDHVIRALAGVVLGSIEESRAEGCFVGHLGDDRLMVVAPSAVLPAAMDRVVARFGSEVRHVESAARRRSSGTRVSAEAPAVRVVAYRDALRQLTSVREVMRSETMLRRLADDQAARLTTSTPTVYYHDLDPSDRAAA